MLFARKKRASDRSSTPGDTPDNKGKVSRENEVKALFPQFFVLNQLVNSLQKLLIILFLQLLISSMIIFSEVWLPEHCTLAECLFHTYLLELFVWSPQSRRDCLLKRTFGDQMRWWKEHFEGAVNLIFSLWRRKRWGNPGEDLFSWRLLRERKTPAGIWWDSPAETEEYFSNPILSSSFIWRSASGLVFRKRPAHFTQENVHLQGTGKEVADLSSLRFLSWSWKTETGLLSNCKACKGTNKILSLV